METDAGTGRDTPGNAGSSDDEWNIVDLFERTEIVGLKTVAADVFTVVRGKYYKGVLQRTCSFQHPEQAAQLDVDLGYAAIVAGQSLTPLGGG